MSFNITSLTDKHCAICETLLLDGDELSTPQGCSTVDCVFHKYCLNEWRKTALENGLISCPVCKNTFALLADVKSYTSPAALPSLAAKSHIGMSTTMSISNPIPSSTVVHDKQDNTQECIAVSSLQASQPTTLADAMNEELTKQVESFYETDNDDDLGLMRLHVRRSQFWEDACKEIELMNPDEWRPKVRITFVGEAGADTGGLAREFFSLFYTNASTSSLLTGEYPFYTFSHDIHALQADKYKLFGKVVALSLINSHPGPHYFCPSVANFLIDSGPVTNQKELLMELPRKCAPLREKLEKIAECTDEQVFAQLVDDLPERFEFGFSKNRVFIKDKLLLLQAASRHFLVSCCMEEIMSFKEGLAHCNVLSNLQMFRDEAVNVFIKQKLAVKDFEEIFKPTFSEEGSNRRVKEEQTYCFWLNFLKECQRGKLVRKFFNLRDFEEGIETEIEKRLSLQDVLQFLTGAQRKPLVSLKGKIVFNHESVERVVSRTCELELTIPVIPRYTESREKFVEHFTEDILEGPDFGQI